MNGWVLLPDGRIATSDPAVIVLPEHVPPTRPLLVDWAARPSFNLTEPETTDAR